MNFSQLAGITAANPGLVISKSTESIILIGAVIMGFNNRAELVRLTSPANRL